MNGVTRYVRSTVDRTMPNFNVIRGKAFTENFVAYDAEKQHWFELQGDTLVEYDVLTKKNSNEMSLTRVLEVVFPKFAEANSLTNSEQNFLKSVMFKGVGPLPEELDKFRGIGLTFGPSRPAYYFDIFSRFKWYDNGVPTLVFCDGYSGIEELPRSVASDMSFLNTNGSRVVLTGEGKNLITSAREKLDGDLVCYIETVSPNMGYVTNYCLHNVISMTSISGYGYVERIKGLDFHISGTVGVPDRPYQNFDSFQKCDEGLVLNVNGAVYKLKNVNTYEVTCGPKGGAYDSSNVFVSHMTNPHKFPLISGCVYECCEGTGFSVIKNIRYSRGACHKLAQINNIKNCPVFSEFEKFLVGAPIFVTPPPSLVCGNTLHNLNAAKGIVVPPMNFKSLSLKNFIEIVENLTVKGSTTVSQLLRSLTQFNIVMSISKILRLVMYAGCTYRSNTIRRMARVENLARCVTESRVRSQDEIVVAKCSRGEFPQIRSLFVYDSFLNRFKPKTVVLILRCGNLIFFTRPPHYDYWDFSAGGMVAWGETDDVAIRRETKEELEIDISFVRTSNIALLDGNEFNFKESYNEGVCWWSYFHVYEIELPECMSFRCGENRIGVWKNFKNVVPMRHDYDLFMSTVLKKI